MPTPIPTAFLGPIGWPELVLLFFLFLLPALLVTGIVLIATGGRSSGAPGGEMACGGCGYSVRGLEQLSCPECGVDLRTAGITAGGSSGKRTAGIVLVVISGLLLLSCCGLGAMSYMWIGSSSTMQTVPIQSQPYPAPALQDQVEDAVEIRDEDVPQVDEEPGE